MNCLSVFNHFVGLSIKVLQSVWPFWDIQYSSVIRQKGESQDERNKKTKPDKFLVKNVRFSENFPYILN